jgi:HAD superfamily hydrolase (TIGR01458 family)
MLLLEEDAMAEFESIDTSNPNSVLIGLSPTNFHYEKLTEAMRILLETKGPLIAIHKGRYFARKDGLALGPGPFVAALEYCTDCEAVVVGKPSQRFFDKVVKSMELKPEDCVMIGDDVRDDCGGAIAAGLKGYLVRTGKYRAGDETRYSEIALDGVFDTFADSVNHLLQHSGS